MKYPNSFQFLFLSSARFICAFMVIWILYNPHHASAYNDVPHRQIVIDAFNYILQKKNDDIVYIDKSTPRSDYELVRAVLAPTALNEFELEERVKLAAKQIAEEAVRTDGYTDVTFTTCFIGCEEFNNVAGYSFTMFSHFLNVYREGLLWGESGYYYGWVKQNEKCTSDNLKDKIGNWLIDHLGAIFKAGSSITLLNYRDPLRNGIDKKDYETHFTQTVEHINFWPITNLAQYWYDSFGGEPSRNRNTNFPFRLVHLGPVLHAAADTTVPFHAVGLSGCGHVGYEKSIDGYYASGTTFYDDKKILAFLVEDQSLSQLKTVHEILHANALLSGGNCEAHGNTSDCRRSDNGGRLETDTSLVSTLINRAIASTVVLIRKGFFDWKEKNERTNPVKHANFETGESEPVQYFASWKNVPVDHLVPTRAAFSLPKSDYKSFQTNLTKMRDAIGSAQSGEIDRAAFKTSLNRAIDESSRILVRQEITSRQSLDESTFAGRDPKLPRLGPRPLEFRPPTREEIQDDAKWQKYVEEFNLFNESANLFHVATENAFLKAKYNFSTIKEEKNQIQRSLAKNNDRISALTLAILP